MHSCMYASVDAVDVIFEASILEKHKNLHMQSQHARTHARTRTQAVKGHDTDA